MIYPSRATTREVRTLDSTNRGRARALQQTARPLETARGANASSSAPVARPFQTSLWDAFSGTPARPAVNSPAVAKNSPAAAGGSRVEAATSASTRSGSAITPTNTNTTRVVTQNSTDPESTPAPVPDLLSRVRTALNSVGLNPDQYNLRIGSHTISYPNIPSFEYPVLFADINGQTNSFYLNGVAQNPGMFAVNVSAMLGRPVMHQVDA